MRTMFATEFSSCYHRHKSQFNFFHSDINCTLCFLDDESPANFTSKGFRLFLLLRLKIS